MMMMMILMKKKKKKKIETIGQCTWTSNRPRVTKRRVRMESWVLVVRMHRLFQSSSKKNLTTTTRHTIHTNTQTTPTIDVDAVSVLLLLLCGSPPQRDATRRASTRHWFGSKRRPGPKVPYTNQCWPILAHPNSKWPIRRLWIERPRNL